MQLSQDFSSDEFACHCGKCGLDGTQIDPNFITKLQLMRDECGFPFTITSGVRCPEHNQLVGGEPGSKHLVDETGYSHACDIQIKTDFDRYRILKSALNVGMSGVGVAENIVHVDNRINPVCFTYYAKVRSSLQ